MLAIAEPDPSVRCFVPEPSSQYLATQLVLHLKDGEHHGLVGLQEALEVVDGEWLVGHFHCFQVRCDTVVVGSKSGISSSLFTRSSALENVPFS